MSSHGLPGRGGLNSQHPAPPSIPMKPQFAQGAAMSDPRFTQPPATYPSPQHGGYGSRGWSGTPYTQHQYSPYAGPGPYGNPYQSSPSYGAPSQPMPFQYRGAYRGNSSYPRNQYPPSRGNYRGSSAKGQWSHSPPPSNGNAATSPANEQVEMTAGQDNPFRPPKDLQVEDSGKEKGKAPAPVEVQTPSAASASKISFAFNKPSSKSLVTTSSLEISQKLTAAPQRKSAVAADASRDDKERPGPATPSDKLPDKPKKAEEPAEPPKPEVRIVKKTVSRLKSKPNLPPEYACAESVYFRKPGNESVIGSGTYGKVFKGVQVYSGREVALKRIRMEGEKDGFPVTSVREIKLLQSLRHKNVVRLLEVMVERNDCFMVFEYLSHDLTGVLNHPTFRLDNAQKKHLIMQMFQGLAYLHRRGVLHRDLKAANILVGRDGTLKLADFGLARFYAKHHQLDYTNRVITIWYRPPELVLGETRYGPAVDVWSAACVVMEIFTGRAVFPGEGTEHCQLVAFYSVIGTPNTRDWPGLRDMAWFCLLNPGYRKPSTFRQKYESLLSPAAFCMMENMFQYDPAKRPTAEEALEHAYFVAEKPAPKAVELENISEFHEYESKALRQKEREREKKDRHRRDREREKEKLAAVVRTKDKAKAKSAAAALATEPLADEANGAQAAAASNAATVLTAMTDRDRKRPSAVRSPLEPQREAKRPHVGQDPGAAGSPNAVEPVKYDAARSMAEEAAVPIANDTAEPYLEEAAQRVTEEARRTARGRAS